MELIDKTLVIFMENDNKINFKKYFRSQNNT